MQEVLRSDFTHIAEALSSLGIPTTADDVWNRFADKRYSPQEPVPVAEDVSPEVEQYLLERSSEFPGVIVDRRSVREYPYGTLAAHLIGYVGEINEEELVDRGGKIPGGGGAASSTTTTARGSMAKSYELGDSIGKTGVERAYEEDLRAVPGQRTIEVNAKGEMLDVVSENPPVPGDDIWLSIDLDLQANAEKQLAERIDSLSGGQDRGGRPTKASQGSVVVTEPMTGEVLAMASYPTYDPAAIVNGISSEMWAQFQDPASGLPLNNWAMQGTYAPGSTFKPFTALAGLRTGFLRPGNETFSDSGVYQLQGCKGQKCEFQNAGRRGHGSVNLSRSLTVSSDTYYYRIGEQLWLSREATGETPIQDVAREFGLGEPTGIEVRGEASGRIPTPESRIAANEENPEAFPNPEWYTGDNVITAIGQGDVLVTPLQLVNAYAALANGGKLMRPHTVHQVTHAIDAMKPPGEPGNYEVVRIVEPEVIRTIDLPADQLLKIVQGLVGVTQSPEGTANASWQDSPTAWPLAGKTGTAQVNGKADTSVFVGWGPAATGLTPSHAVSVIVPEAGFGSDVAAPLSFRILAPASKGELPEACPVAEPDRSRCEERNAATASEGSSADHGATGAQTYGGGD